MQAVEVRYGPVPALRDVSMEIRRGEIVCLLGGNASGKSTTMKTVLGIVKPTTGRVEFAGEDVTDRPVMWVMTRAALRVSVVRTETNGRCADVARFKRFMPVSPSNPRPEAKRKRPT